MEYADIEARWLIVQGLPVNDRTSACVCCAGPALLTDDQMAQVIATPVCSHCEARS